VTFAATLLQAIETGVAGQAYLEALVLAILLGVAIRTFWTPGLRFEPGIVFCAKILLEVAVVLLGASVSVRTVLALGPSLLVGIALIVAIAIVVLLLPLLVPLLALSLTQYGVLAGLTVYAVPQVLAATLPIGALSNQVGTVVKLVRVLMLGPVVLGLSLIAGGLRGGKARVRPALHELVPWFIAGFLAVLAIRSAGLVPAPALPAIKTTAALLTTISMAALGLGVDVRVVARAGVRVTAAVTLSLIVLCAISLGLIRLLSVS
jgi:uncharacterized membrane protein YadS